MTQAELNEASRCFICEGMSLAQANILVLLNAISESLGGGSATCRNLSGTASPQNVVTPEFAGQTYTQDDGTIWQAGSTENSSWTVICTPGAGTDVGVQWGPDPETLSFPDTSPSMANSIFDVAAITSIVFSDLVTMTDENNGQGITVYLGNTVVSYSFPELVTVNADFLDGSSLGSISSWSSPKLETVRGDFLLYGNPLTALDISALETVGGECELIDDSLLVSVDYPSLVSVGGTITLASSCPNLTSISAPVLQIAGGIDIYGCPLLPSVSLPALTSTTGGFFQMVFCDILTTISLPVYLPTNGEFFLFNNNALSAASVNHLLARAVANPAYVSGTIDLSGQTPAQPPTGQGVIDAGILMARGVTVITD